MIVDHLPYVPRLDKRPLERIDLVVVHCTELPDIVTARVYGERIHHEESRTGNSGHYYIERDGQVQEWVPPDRVAHHVRGFNDSSIGIELDHPGRYPEWFDSRRQVLREPYTQVQLENLVRLVNTLRRAIPTIHLASGHDRLDTARVPSSDQPGVTVRRKVDPGPLFPWDRFLAATGLEFFEPPDGPLGLVSGRQPR